MDELAALTGVMSDTLTITRHSTTCSFTMTDMSVPIEQICVCVCVRLILQADLFVCCMTGAWTTKEELNAVTVNTGCV